MTSVLKIMNEIKRQEAEGLDRLFEVYKQSLPSVQTAPNSTTQNVVPPKTQDATGTGTPHEKEKEDIEFLKRDYESFFFRLFSKLHVCASEGVDDSDGEGGCGPSSHKKRKCITVISSEEEEEPEQEEEPESRQEKSEVNEKKKKTKKVAKEGESKDKPKKPKSMKRFDLLKSVCHNVDMSLNDSTKMAAALLKGDDAKEWKFFFDKVAEAFNKKNPNVTSESTWKSLRAPVVQSLKNDVHVTTFIGRCSLTGEVRGKKEANLLDVNVGKPPNDIQKFFETPPSGAS
jgi:hypothetical protein